MTLQGSGENVGNEELYNLCSSRNIRASTFRRMSHPHM
jgi:hypothetical protein